MTVESAPPEVRATPTTAIAERRLVTILFADLVGFTPFSEERDAEEVRETLSRYFEVAKDVVGRHGGTIEKFIGDAVMAVWGTPTAHEDDAERAVRAGLELVEAVRAIAPEIHARAGILTGEAAVNVGATDQAMVAGDLVNSASRLQAAAPAGSVLVGEITYRAASKAIVFEKAGDQLLKGKRAPVAAWRALRVVAEVGGRNRSETVEAPFVGREAELRLLKDLLHATTRERRARLVSITGIAGIGKSRLAWEFAKYLDGVVETVRWHAGRSPAYGEGVAFWALGEMVRSRAGLLETDDQETTRAKIAATVAEWIPAETERRWVGSAFLALLGAGEPPPGGRDALFGAWRTFFERIAARDTVVMVFEDLHWADSGLLDFIDHLVDWASDVPIYVVTLARPELIDRRPDWGAGKRNFTGIGLNPMSDVEMRALLGGLVPGLSRQAEDAIVARAEGVPLYAVETVRALVADGRLVEADGAYRPAGDLGDLTVPETLHALIAARLDALDPADRALLQDAAVLGQSFTPAALASITGMSTESLATRLRALARKEMIAHKVDPRSPERGQYSFVQALIREVAYNTLARAERRIRHLAAARWFESLGEDELAGALAAHYLAAHEYAAPGPEAEALATQARLALRGAGERASSLGSYAQALSLFDQALTVATEPTDQVELLLRGADAATYSGGHEAAARHAERALELARSLEDRSLVARATAILGRAYLNAYRQEDAIALLVPADAEFADLELDRWAIAISGQLARARFFAEDHAGAVEVADRVLPRAERADVVEVVADTLVTKGSALCDLGRMYEGIGMLKTGRSLAEAHGLTNTMFRAVANLTGHLSSLDPRAALDIGRDAFAQAERLGWPINVTLLVNIAGCATRTGDWDLYRQLVDDLAARRLEPVDRLRALAMTAVLRAFEGDPDRAVAEMERIRPEIQDRLDAEVSFIEVGAVTAMTTGKFDRGYELWTEMAGRSALNLPYALPMAARCAVWDRDAARVRSALERLDATGIHGPALEVDRMALRAALLGLEGRPADSLALYRDVLRGWRDLGLAFDEAVAGVDMVSVLGAGDPEVRQAAERSRTILSGLGCRSFLELIDRFQRRPSTGPVPAAQPSAATVGQRTPA